MIVLQNNLKKKESDENDWTNINKLFGRYTDLTKSIIHQEKFLMLHFAGF